MTNGDRIRAMTDEELAGFLTYENICGHEECGFYSCEKCALEWIKREVQDDAEH